MVVFALLFLGVVNFVAYYALNAPGPTSGGGSVNSAPGGPTDSVTLGTPSLHSAVCGNGATVTTESVTWVGADVTPTTGQVYLEVVELLDGDVDGGSAPVPTVTNSSVCGGSPLAVNPSWYVVLQAPAGANIASYSYPTGWVILDPASGTPPISNGSTLVLVSDPPLAGTSFALCAMGGIDGLSIDACAQL